MPAPRWSDLDDDPNAPAVVSARRTAVLAARRPPIERREPYLIGLVTEKKVLDVGVVEHRLESRQRGRWLHGKMHAAAATCVGVDVLPEAVAKLNEEGFDVRVCDLTSDRLDETFEVIVIGEVIEHVADPGGLLRNAAAMLEAGGRIVLTTPNPYALHRVWQGVRNKPQESADHVTLFAPTHLYELAQRCGLDLASWRGIRVKDLDTPRGRALSAVRKVADRLLSEDTACDSILYELTPG